MLNEAREKLEQLIDIAHRGGFTVGRKSRTHQRRARREYLRYARNRKRSRKFLRKSLKKQLGYVRRDLQHLEELKEHPGALDEYFATREPRVREN